MSQILTLDELLSFSPQTFSPKKWSILIPAAGRGSRLDSTKPKILFPILNRPIINWLIQQLKPYGTKFIFVVSPHGEPLISSYLQNKFYESIDYELVIQETPSGMGDAILLGLEKIQTPYTTIIWGDQIVIRSKTIELSMMAHENRKDAVITLPTVMKPNPYIHFQRDPSQKIIAILQAREKKIPLDIGENDGGIFFTTTTLIKTELLQEKTSQNFGSLTGEFNFLPVIVRADKNMGHVVTLRILEEDETVGINTLEEAQKVTSILISRGSKNE